MSFTSSEFITIDVKGEALAGRFAIEMKRDDIFRKCLPKVRDPALPTISDVDYRHLRRVTVDAPAKIGCPCWRPGSSNVIRREMLRALAFDRTDAALFGGVDAYFLLPMFAVTGATLIGLALSAYRVHDDNDHSRRPYLRNIRDGNEGAYLRNTAVKKLSLLSLINNSDKLLEIVGHRYFRIVEIVGKNAVDSLFVPPIFSDPEVRTALAKAYPFLTKVFGEPTVVHELGSLTNLRHLIGIIVMSTASSPAGTLGFSDTLVRKAVANAYPSLVEVFRERTVIRELHSLMTVPQTAAIIAAANRGRIPFKTLRRLCMEIVRKPRPARGEAGSRTMRLLAEDSR